MDAAAAALSSELALYFLSVLVMQTSTIVKALRERNVPVKRTSVWYDQVCGVKALIGLCRTEAEGIRNRFTHKTKRKITYLNMKLFVAQPI